MISYACMRRFAVLFAATLLFAVTVATARNADAVTLHFLAEAGYAPYSFAYGEDARGIDCEIFMELARRLELNVTIDLRPRAEMLRMLRNGEADGAVALQRLPILAERVVYASRQALRVNSYDLFSHVGKRIDYQGPESLANVRIAMPEGVYPDRKLDAAEKQGMFEVVRAPGESDCVRLLLMNQADAFVGQTEATYDMLTKMGMTSTILASPQSIGRDSSYIAISKTAAVKSPEDMARLMEFALADMLVDGTYRAIQRRYLLKQ